MAVKTHGISVVRANENHVFLRPRMWAWRTEVSKPAVIAAPGRGAGAGQPMAVPYFGHVTEALAAAGYPVLSVQGGVGLFEWGSAEAVASIEAGRLYLESLGAPVDSVFLLGISMGNAALLNWARTHSSFVRAQVATIPVVDVQQHYATDTPSSAAAQISTAHGGAPAAANNPAANPDDVTWPVRFYTASDDPSCPPAWTASFAAAIGSNAEVRDLGAVGHTPITTPAAEVVEFFDSHVAGAS